MMVSIRLIAGAALLLAAGACSSNETVGQSAGGGAAGATTGGAAGATTGGAAGAITGGAAGSGGAAANDASAGGGKADGSSADTAPESAAPALVNPAPGSKFFVGANFWNIDWEGQGDFFVSNVDFATTTNPWRPELIADLAPYRVLRFMDWNLTNNSNNPQADWSTRKQKTAAQNEPVAFEWQIDLCNRTKKDYWVNVPHESVAAYWPKLAELVFDQLDPSLRVYVEWSNEVWNGTFPQRTYAADKGQSLGLAGSDKAASYYVYASVRAYEAFEQVFGKGSPRLVKVLAGQAAWTGPCDAHVTALGDKTINPNGTMPDVYAIAPYVSGTTMQALTAEIATVTGWTSSSYTCAKKKNLPLVSYEGGSDSFAAGNGCTTLQHDAGMHDLYVSYLDAISGAKLAGPFMQYTHTGACWGLKEKTGDPLTTSPKYKGVVDWLAAHP